MRLSVSKIEEYTKCPYSYYLAHVKNVQVAEAPPRYLTMGVEVHELFDKTYDVLEGEQAQVLTATQKAEMFDKIQEMLENWELKE